jgi:Gpi18-like mannosyltransferase
VKNIFTLNGPVLWLILKLPAIIADLGMGYLAYKLASKNFSKLAGTAIAAFAVLNPTVILNSSVWGQVDSILGFFCVLAVYFASENKLNVSFFAFAVALLIKPQALFFAPVLVFCVIDEYFLTDKFDTKAFIKTVFCGMGALLFMLVSFMPFGNTPIHGIMVIIDQYIATIGQYNYMTVNAFNLYGALGLNWTELTTFVSIFGYIFIVAVVVFSGVVFFKNKGSDRYYLTSFILVFGIYMLSAKMHERYAFPGIFMLIMALASVPSNKNAILYGLFSLSQFFNIAWVLFVYESNPSKYFKSPIIIIASIINIILFGWGCLQVCKATSTKHKNVGIQKEINEKALKYHKELGLYLIGANDSHYIYPNQAKERLELLRGKGINYGDEDTFILDYPDYDTFAKRFKKQGLLTDSEIVDAIEQTLIFEECENIDIDKTIKMPTIYPNLSNEEKIKLLKKEVNDNFKLIMKEDNIDKETRKKYVEECRREMKVIEDTNEEIHTADYFLLNKQVYDLASGKYHGTLTKTGRGSCFTKTALVLTKEGYKTIDNVKIGDEVISDDCRWHKVINTMSFDVCEPLIEFTHYKQGSVYKKYKNQCTLDHKLLVNRDGNINYIEAKDVIVGDLLCSPKIKNEYNDEFKEVIDLNDYNIFGYDYDDNYIYEKTFIANKGYKYSPKWFEKNGYAVNPTFAKNVMNGWRPKANNPRTKRNTEELLKVTNFKSLDDYENYCKYKCIKIMPIKRFVKNDMFFNCIIGMMYGDGWTQKDYAIGFAVNNDSKTINRKLFIKFANMLGYSYDDMYENVAKEKNLQQLFINSHILNNFWKTNFFTSKKGDEKLFNQKLFNQPQQNLKGLLY